jgi:mono/diheme cytochrome c family protein
MGQSKLHFGALLLSVLFVSAGVVSLSTGAFAAERDTTASTEALPETSKSPSGAFVLAADDDEYDYLDDTFEDEEELREILSTRWNPVAGEKVFKENCVSCHGADGKGAIPEAPDFTEATGRLVQGDAILLVHIARGFQSMGSDAAMPAEGGNPALSMEDIMNVLTYMKQDFYFDTFIEIE